MDNNRSFSENRTISKSNIFYECIYEDIQNLALVISGVMEYSNSELRRAQGFGAEDVC